MPSIGPAGGESKMGCTDVFRRNSNASAPVRPGTLVTRLTSVSLLDRVREVVL